jgi:hypothetical protein
MFAAVMAVTPVMGPEIAINVLAGVGTAMGAPVVVEPATEAALATGVITAAALVVAPVAVGVTPFNAAKPAATSNTPVAAVVTLAVMAGASFVFKDVSGVPNSAVAAPPTKPLMST